ncbi:MAG TPA: glycosyltransferase family 2 protein [Terriglobales bacterium]|nr:glycosyltransferase family 2 protein [Terriglobales bacterium]
MPELVEPVESPQAIAEIAESPDQRSRHSRPAILPVSVIVPVRNEERNLPRCLESLRGMGEVYVIDSQSSDATQEIARSFDATLVQFHYRGGWPKKRQWALDTLPLAFDWILLLDADEVVTPELAHEIEQAIHDRKFDGYYLKLQMHFLGRELRHCGANFYKLSLFRRGKGHFERRIEHQDTSMCDMEIHEHVIVDGPTARLRHALTHRNVEALSHYIRKHDQYSNWESRVLTERMSGAAEIQPYLFGTQAQRRRWLKKVFFSVPGSPIALFLYRYLLRLGFLDGVPGLIYCGLQAVQMFHTKAKIYEMKVA